MTLTDFANRVKSRLDALGEPWEWVHEPAEYSDGLCDCFVSLRGNCWQIMRLPHRGRIVVYARPFPRLHMQQARLTAALNDDAGNVAREVTG